MVGVSSPYRWVVGAALGFAICSCTRKQSEEAPPTQNSAKAALNGEQRPLDSSPLLRASTQLSSGATRLPLDSTQRPSSTGAPLTATGNSTSSDLHSDGDGCAVHAQPLRQPPPGASATSLSPGKVSKISRISVSAHEGAVVLRRNKDSSWVSVGKRGCTVSAARVQAALVNLTHLRVKRRHAAWPSEAQFELQIDALDGEEHALHLEIGPRRADADFAKLLNDDVIELRGLDRQLWSVDPAAWCP